MLKGCMVRERLGTPDLNKRELSAFPGTHARYYKMYNGTFSSAQTMRFCKFWQEAPLSKHELVRGTIAREPEMHRTGETPSDLSTPKRDLFRSSHQSWLHASGETSTLGQGGQITVVGARVKTVKYMTSSCSFNLGTTFLQHSFPHKLRPNPRPPALC